MKRSSCSFNDGIVIITLRYISELLQLIFRSSQTSQILDLTLNMIKLSSLDERQSEWTGVRYLPTNVKLANQS